MLSHEIESGVKAKADEISAGHLGFAPLREGPQQAGQECGPAQWNWSMWLSPAI